MVTRLAGRELRAGWSSGLTPKPRSLRATELVGLSFSVPRVLLQADPTSEKNSFGFRSKYTRQPDDADIARRA